MSHHQSGRRPQGQHNNFGGSSTLPHQYGVSTSSQPTSNHNVRRATSFDQGDDTSDPGGTNSDLQERAYGRRDYRTRNNTGSHNENLYSVAPSPPTTNPSSSRVVGTGGYQHQNSSYNPQQYGTPQVSYSPQLSGGTSHNPGTGYQPYVPAAYQTPASPRRSSHGAQSFVSLPQSYSIPATYQSPFQPPPPPPRPNEQRYSDRASPQIGTLPTLQHSTSRHESPYWQPTLPSRTGYTPPAPPPPPFSPAHDAFPSHNSTKPSPISNSHRSPISQFASQPLPHRSPSSHDQPPSLPPRMPSNGYPKYPANPSRPLPISPPLGLNNSLPPTPGTSGPTPPQHSPQRMNTTGRHPQARPLPGPPSESGLPVDYFGGYSPSDNVDNGDYEEPGYEDLIKEVEAAVMGRAPTSSSQRSPRRGRMNDPIPMDEGRGPRPLQFGASDTSAAPDTVHTYTNGYTDSSRENVYIDTNSNSDGSDAEAEAGLAAMYMAEEQEAADEARRHSGGESLRGLYRSQQHSKLDEPLELSSDSDVNVDMDTYGGGFSGHVHYGDENVSNPSSQANLSELGDQRRFLPTPSSSQRSQVSSNDQAANSGLYDYSIPDQDDIHPFPPTLGARVDTSGTGGLSEPTPHPRRLSFEDGDEAILAESEGKHTSITLSSLGEGTPEMFFHPGSGHRPLPPAPVGFAAKNRVPQLMPAGSYQNPGRPQQYDQSGHPWYPPAPDAYDQLHTPSGTPVPRSTSLLSHPSTPQTVPPIRSKTDADRARIFKQQQMMGARTASMYGSEAAPDSSLSQGAELLGLPEIPLGKRRKFNPGKLSSYDFKKCAEPWAMSSVISWIKQMSEGEADLREHAIVDGIVALFTHKVPTMNTADAETLGARVVSAMFDSGTLLKEEEWVKFGTESMSGVLFQLTGSGCYSPRIHTQTLPGRCYAHHCMRTLKKINLHTQVLETQRKVEDWATFYKVSKAGIENASKKEVERQNILHEIVTTEDSYMDQLNVLRVLYRDELSKWQPPIITPKRKEKFLNDVFGKVDAIKQVNEDYLLAQLKYRQQEQGPWIVGFSDIFREWVRKARNAYIDYAASFPNATFLVRQEADRNILFRQFLDQMRDNERSKRLGWDTYLKSPITRLQRYGLFLSTVHRNMIQDSEEKKSLQAAINEIKAVTLECDTRVADMSKNVDLSELAAKLILRPGMEKVQLNLTHLGREIIFKGDLQRSGNNKFTWLETHAILFDHYLVLAKTITQRDPAGGLKHQKYDVSKLPIPMDLLVLESANDDPVVKSSVKGINVTTVTRPSLVNQNGASGSGILTHTTTATSIASVSSNGTNKMINSTTTLDAPKDERSMFPFRIKHLGKADMYTLYAPTAQNRQDWCDKIIEAKTKHAASLFEQNAEPFRLRVVADTAFAYDPMTGGPKTITIRGTPLDRAIREVETHFEGKGSRPGPVCRATVNCATAFYKADGNLMVAVGTDYGVYISDHNNPRGWTKAIFANRVTQIAVLEDFSLFLLIADKSLIAHHLDSVCPVHGSSNASASSESSSRRAPQKLSGARDVGFFATGRMKDRTLVFYKKRGGISSTFRVLEPIYHKSSSTARTRHLFRTGTTDFFRNFDDFYIPSESYAINLFQSSLAIATARGIEVMTLDKKVPFSIPDLKPPECASIAARIRDQKPLGMFRLSDSEFLLVFEEVGIYVNKHGDVSRAVVMEFVGRARQAVLYGGMYLVLVDNGGGFVEVRNAVNGRLRQVVSGRDVRLLDDGAGGGTVKICMQHPEFERCQVVVEMIVKQGLKE